MTEPAPALTFNGWTILLHPLFVRQVAATVADVRRVQARDPAGYTRKNCAKRLKAILKLSCADIPADPSSTAYRLGSSLGADYTHWFRAKFFQQYRLFFRYDASQKIIIYGWVNDESTRRAYGSDTDAYSVFSSMLATGNPPDDWDSLRDACIEENRRRHQAGEADVLIEARALPSDEQAIATSLTGSFHTP